MKKYSKIQSLLMLILTPIILLSVPKTSAKYLTTIEGVAWENYFTAFSQLKEVFYITQEEEKIEDLWGAIISDAVINDIGGGKEIVKDTSIGDGDYYTFGKLTDNNNNVSSDVIRNAYSEYLIENLNGIELNVVNQTDKPVVIAFKIYYYAPKYATYNDPFWGSPSINENGTALSFEVYNTIENINGKVDENGRNAALRGEFIVNAGSGYFPDGQYNNLVEVPAERTSGAANSEIELDGTWIGGTIYYPHRAVINPYEILYNPSTNVKYPKTYINESNEEVIYRNIAGDSMAFKYPAYDIQTSNNANHENIMKYVDINDFILEPSEAGSFNLSLYYGNLTNTTNNTVSFVTSLSMVSIPLEDEQAKVNSLING